MEKTIILVYGTLRKGESNHAYLQSSKYLGIGKIEGELWGKYDWFPYLTLGNGTVKGEIYEINELTFRAIDGLEGYPYHYNRKEVPVKIQGQEETIKAWVYFVDDQGEQSSKIESGDWLNRGYNPTQQDKPKEEENDESNRN